MIDEVRLPLYSIEAEMSVLGSMILAQRASEQCVAMLEESDFFRPAHQLVFRALSTLVRKRSEIDIVMLRDELTDRNLLGDAGDVDYLLQLAEYVPSAANAKYYAQIVIDKATVRRLEFAARSIIDVVHDPELEGADTRVKLAQSLVENVLNRKSLNAFTPMRDILRKIDNAWTNMDEGTVLKPISTGFVALDKLVDGFMPGEFWIIAARPSMGKSALAGQLAVNAALQGAPTGIFSSEMGNLPFISRLVAGKAGYSAKIFRKPPENLTVMQRIADEMEGMYDLPIGIDDRMPDIDRVFYQCKEFQKDHGGGHCVFFVDYLQFVTPALKRGETMNDAVSKVSKVFKSIATQLNCTMVCLSQLSRAVESREDKRPQLADLRDSGAIEQDADIVLMLYRGPYYSAKAEGISEGLSGSAEFLIRKNRNGPGGKVDAIFYTQETRFEDVA